MPEEYAELTEAQLDLCTSLFVAVFNAEPWNDGWTFSSARQRLQDLFATPGFFGVLAMREEPVALEPVAFMMGYREQWPDRVLFALKEVGVRPDLQRQGIGSRLLRHLEQELVTRLEVTTVYLATTREGPAAAFYRKHAYRTQERIVWMSHRLAPRVRK